MSKFTDDIKASEWAKEIEASQANEIRLHNAKIAKAKAPILWREVIEQIKHYCEEFKELTLKNPKFRFHVSDSPDGFLLVNDGPLPRREIQANLDLDGQCVKVLSRIKSSFQDQSLLKPLGFMSISVDGSDELSFRLNSETWCTPEAIAEFFVKFVCEIK